jgi:peptidyl-prolyl cis-trans isomerase B (cyclophilin B)
MRIALAFTAILLAATLAGCTANQDTSTPTGPTRVLIKTSVGDMTAELYGDKAPITVANFLRYVEEGFYTNLQCYRIEPNFVNQCGGERLGKTGTHAPIKNEAKTSGLRNEKYTIAMARTNNPDSATTEFYINAADNCFLDHPSVSTCPERAASVSADGYAVFGALISGKDVSDRINGMAGQPPPTLVSITLVSGGAPNVPPASTGAAARCSSLEIDLPYVQAPVEVDLITPGVWNVCSNTEYNYVWIHNGGATRLDYKWSITLKDGAALPPGWTVTFQNPSGILEPNGTKASSGPRVTYPDWAASRVTLKIPTSQKAGMYEAELRAGGTVRPFVFNVQEPRGSVSGPGSSVTVQYDGRFADDQSQFDSGEFPTTLGSGQTVPGFDNGLMGLAKGESTTLIIPPPFAYGYDNPPGNYQRFNGRTLMFIVTMSQLS